MTKWMLCLLMIPILLAGCSPADPPEQAEPIEVEFTVDPERVKAGEITTLRVLVKQGEERVEDAQEVQFEIWKEGQEKHDLVDADNMGDGIYELKEKFHDPGLYYVIYHVTARDMHNMEKVEIQVEGS